MVEYIMIGFYGLCGIGAAAYIWWSYDLYRDDTPEWEKTHGNLSDETREDE